MRLSGANEESGEDENPQGVPPASSKRDSKLNVLRMAHRIRVEQGDGNITEKHLKAAAERLV